MRRRKFITLLGGTVVVWPLAARAQQPAMPVVGFFRHTSRDGSAHLLPALRRGLSEGGYIEGQNLAVEYRWSDNRFDRLPALAADLVRRHCAVIMAGGNAAALAAKAATATIPIVFSSGDDPVKLGLVASLNRPVGNVTGVFFYSGADLESKQLELLREIAPKVTVIGLLVNPTSTAAESQARNAQLAARALGQQIAVLNASDERDFDSAFANLDQQRAGALVIGGDAFFNGNLDRLGALASRYGVPTIASAREFVMAGGLMSYGASLADAYRQIGIYAGRILNGAKPADLPVMQPTKFELIVNLKSAKAIGLAIPETFLVRADEVIE
jgi:putative tryptophan/tyrosine transport system substrate-binding protein